MCIGDMISPVFASTCTTYTVPYSICYNTTYCTVYSVSFTVLVDVFNSIDLGSYYLIVRVILLEFEAQW